MRDLVEFDSISAKATVADENFEAYSLVKGASSFVKLEMLHKITAKGEVTYNEGDQNDLFNSMKVFANENGTLLLKNWNNYKATISSLIEKFKAFDALGGVTVDKLLLRVRSVPGREGVETLAQLNDEDLGTLRELYNQLKDERT